MVAVLVAAVPVVVVVVLVSVSVVYLQWNRVVIKGRLSRERGKVSV